MNPATLQSLKTKLDYYFVPAILFILIAYFSILTELWNCGWFNKRVSQGNFPEKDFRTPHPPFKMEQNSKV